jgi:probable F420-dependent oxidoreductase
VKIGFWHMFIDEGIHPVELGRALEERGFEALFVGEHTNLPVDDDQPMPNEDQARTHPRIADPLVALSVIAGATERLTLGTSVLLAAQHEPIATAKAIASLDAFSGGRVVLGVGAGWHDGELRQHGVDPKKRVAALREHMLAMREIWTKDEAEFHGEHIDLDPIFSWPKPVQKPHVPIYIGGESEAALNRLAKYGDGWLLRGYTKYQEAQRVRQWLAEQGREDVQFAVFGGPTTPKVIDGFREAGVERYTFLLDTLPEAETLKALDELAEVAAAHR